MPISIKSIVLECLLGQGISTGCEDELVASAFQAVCYILIRASDNVPAMIQRPVSLVIEAQVDECCIPIALLRVLGFPRRL